jgi:hypothetical protein
MENFLLGEVRGSLRWNTARVQVSFGPGVPESAQAAWQNSRLFEIAFVLVRLDHVASVNVNANHSTGGWNCRGCRKRALKST